MVGTSVSNRSHRARMIANYLTRSTEIPHLDYRKGSDGNWEIQSPAPYQFRLITDKKWTRFYDRLDNDPERLLTVIRYDRAIDGVENAVIGMRLQSFAPLLRAHVAEITADRPFGKVS